MALCKEMSTCLQTFYSLQGDINGIVFKNFRKNFIRGKIVGCSENDPTTVAQLQ